MRRTKPVFLPGQLVSSKSAFSLRGEHFDSSVFKAGDRFLVLSIKDKQTEWEWEMSSWDYFVLGPNGETGYVYEQCLAGDQANREKPCAWADYLATL